MVIATNTIARENHAPSAPSRRVFIQMSGAPGCGKSTLARLLQPLLGAFVIDHDIFKSPFLIDENTSFTNAAKMAYNLQWTLAEQAAQQGFNVIIDSICNYQEVITQGSAIAQNHNLTYWYIECRVEDIELLDKRLRGRVSLKSQRTAVGTMLNAARTTYEGEEPVGQFKQWIDALCRPKSSANVIMVDTSGDPESVKQYILQRILAEDEVVT